LLRGAFGEAAPECFTRIGEGVLHKFAFLAALRPSDSDFAARIDRERFGQQCAPGHVVAQQHHARRWPVFVELGEESVQHLVRRKLLVVAREIGAVAPVLSGTEKEHLHAGLSAVAPCGKEIRLGEGSRVDALMLLDLRQRADAVAVDRGALEVEIGGCLFHQRHEVLLCLAAAAAQEVARLRDELGVILPVDLAGARRAAPFDLVQETGPRPVFEHGVGASS